jgi:hypothetical protein
MGKWTYRIAIIIMIVAIAGVAIYWIMLQTNPETMTGPWLGEDTWLLYPNGGENVSGVITILWNTSKVKLGPDAEIWIAWSHLPRGASPTFQHEDWEGCYCQVDYAEHVMTESAPNTGEYEWNATQALEDCNGETYPYYIKIVGSQYMDASNRFFNITG